MEIVKLRKIKRKVKTQYETGKIPSRARPSQGILSVDISTVDGSNSDANDDFYADEMTTEEDIGQVRETRLLRERRKLISSLGDYEKELRIHFIGACINLFLVIFSLLMIIIIAKNGGMCIKGMQFENIFKNNQLDKCNLCQDIDGPCEICFFEDAGGTILSSESQCYYPYGDDM